MSFAKGANYVGETWYGKKHGEIIVFSAAVGIELLGGASILSNTHIYGDANDKGGPALVVAGQSVRAVGDYFDGKGVVLIDPMQVEVSHSFFLGTAFTVTGEGKGLAAAAIAPLRAFGAGFASGIGFP